MKNTNNINKGTDIKEKNLNAILLFKDWFVSVKNLDKFFKQMLHLSKYRIHFLYDNNNYIIWYYINFWKITVFKKDKVNTIDKLKAIFPNNFIFMLDNEKEIEKKVFKGGFKIFYRNNYFYNITKWFDFSKLKNWRIFRIDKEIIVKREKNEKNNFKELIKRFYKNDVKISFKVKNTNNYFYKYILNQYKDDINKRDKEIEELNDTFLQTIGEEIRKNKIYKNDELNEAAASYYESTILNKYKNINLYKDINLFKYIWLVLITANTDYKKLQKITNDFVKKYLIDKELVLKEKKELFKDILNNLFVFYKQRRNEIINSTNVEKYNKLVKNLALFDFKDKEDILAFAEKYLGIDEESVKKDVFDNKRIDKILKKEIFNKIELWDRRMYKKVLNVYNKAVNILSKKWYHNLGDKHWKKSAYIIVFKGITKELWLDLNKEEIEKIIFKFNFDLEKIIEHILSLKYESINYNSENNKKRQLKIVFKTITNLKNKIFDIVEYIISILEKISSELSKTILTQYTGINNVSEEILRKLLRKYNLSNMPELYNFLLMKFWIKIIDT